jgi:alpha-beta hydrolase superfamily lysophospholipase
MEALEFAASDGKRLRLYRWLPERSPRAVIQIAHGMGEHAGRYAPVAAQLNAAGYAVYANDHRGHGGSAEPGCLGNMGSDGWNRVIQDAGELARHIGAAHPGVAKVLLGHSMGSMLAQQFAYRFGREIDALVLSGSPGLGGAFSGWLSHTIARFERWRLGHDAESALMQRLVFGSSNRNWDGPDATGFEWLSRDPEQVQAYVDDPLCGFVLRAGSLCDLFAGAREARRRSSISEIPAELPVYVFSGSADPVHAEGANLERLLRRYRSRLRRADYRLYPEGRHEMFNEANRQEVIDDLLTWLEDALAHRTETAGARPA